MKSPARVRAALAAALLAACGSSSAPSTPDSATGAAGVVFDDRNGNARFDAGDFPLAGVQVSDGVVIVETGADGRYQLRPGEGAPYVFVTKPAGYDVPLRDGCVPQHYVRYTGPGRYDFPLRANGGDEHFTAVVMTDSHLEVAVGESAWSANQEPTAHFGEYIEEFRALGADFAVNLGDIGPAQVHADTCRSFGKPLWQVMGNPGHNDQVLDMIAFKKDIEDHLGPLHYSFDYGRYHFIALDTNIVTGEAGDIDSQTLTFGLDPTQRAWLIDELERNRGRTVVLLNHEPPDNTESMLDTLYKLIIGSEPDLWEDRRWILDLVASYEPAAWFSGHVHANLVYHQRGTLFSSVGAISGAWWGPIFNPVMRLLYPGAEEGVNANVDGTPQGYRLLTGTPDTLASNYKRFREPAQLNFASPTPTRIAEQAGANLVTEATSLITHLSYLDQDPRNDFSFGLLVGDDGARLAPDAPGVVRGLLPILVHAASLSGVEAAEYSVDFGDWQPMEHIVGPLWRADWDSGAGLPGLHDIAVRMRTTAGEELQRVVVVTVGAATE